MMYFLACYERSEGGGYLLVEGAVAVATAAAVLGFAWFRKSHQESLIQSRVARGDCVRCGYPLGTHDRCSECGCAASPRHEQG
jgi:hypothetical protein